MLLPRKFRFHQSDTTILIIKTQLTRGFLYIYRFRTTNPSPKLLITFFLFRLQARERERDQKPLGLFYFLNFIGLLEFLSENVTHQKYIYFLIRAYLSLSNSLFFNFVLSDFKTKQKKTTTKTTKLVVS